VLPALHRAVETFDQWRVQVTYVPGLYKIFDEILVNAADNKQRCGGMDSLKVRASSLQRFLALSQLNSTGLTIVVSLGSFPVQSDGSVMQTFHVILRMVGRQGCCRVGFLDDNWAMDIYRIPPPSPDESCSLRCEGDWREGGFLGDSTTPPPALRVRYFDCCPITRLAVACIAFTLKSRFMR